MTPEQRNARLQRFRFVSFDGKDEAPAVAPEKPKADPTPLLSPLPTVPAPSYSEKDLQNARTEAQTQGYREGYSAAQDKVQKETAAREDALQGLLEVIANRITLAAESHAKTMGEREALMGKIILAAARKVAGDALKKEPYAAVESLVQECMAMITGEKVVTIIVSSALAAGLRQRVDMLKPLLSGFSGELKVQEDSALMEQDCRVEWGNGYGERSAEELWKTLEAIIVKTPLNESARV